MRMDALLRLAGRRRLDQVLVCDPANVRAFAGVASDNAVVTKEAVYTDFRYIPAARRVLKGTKLAVRDIKKLEGAMPRGSSGRRIGYESSISHGRFLRLQKLFPRAKFVDISKDLAAIRAVKTAEEIAALRAAARLSAEIWKEASGRFKAGMTELEMARVIRRLMAERGDGESFDTIVCVGRNAAECHHEPDDTVWDGREPVLVDMGVKLGGVCSDMTRNIVPRRPSPRYRQAYDLVRRAHDAAIEAARPGMTAKALDRVARDVIRAGGLGRRFGHALGHGVGYEIHEAPSVSQKGDSVLKEGMVFTIEPGVYIEGDIGIRIEDTVLLTASGCEVLTDPCQPGEHCGIIRL